MTIFDYATGKGITGYLVGEELTDAAEHPTASHWAALHSKDNPTQNVSSAVALRNSPAEILLIMGNLIN